MYSENRINDKENESVRLLKKVVGFISHLMSTQLSANHLFHNWHHTHNVVRGVQEISDSLDLSSTEREIVLLAAYFHDSGHVTKCIGHEEESQKIAYKFLVKNKYLSKNIEKVVQCIAATKIPQSPKCLLEEVICDADLFHLSTVEYLSELELLRKEWLLIAQIHYSEKNWMDMNLNFLRAHQYYTKYGKENLEAGKQQNIKRLEKYRAKLK